MLDVLLEVVLPVMLVAALGGAAGRRLGFSLETFSKAVFYLFSPALVFVSISTIELPGGDIGRVMAVAVIVFAANVLAATVWSTLRRDPRPVRACLLLAGAVVNQGNMGLPMAKLAFGQPGLDIAVVAFVTSVLLWSSAGIALGAWARGGHSPTRALMAPLRYPSIYAAAAGAVVNIGNLKLPVFVTASSRSLADAAIPSMLVVLGLQFRRPKVDDLVGPLSASVNRLLIGPLVAWPAAVVIGLHGIGQQTSIMMAGMPTAVMVTILAVELDADPEQAVASVVVSTALSVATLTVLISLLR